MNTVFILNFISAFFKGIAHLGNKNQLYLFFLP